MAAKDERKLMGYNLRMSGEDTPAFLHNIGASPKRTEFDLNQYPSENMELEPRQFDLNQYPSENMELEPLPVGKDTTEEMEVYLFVFRHYLEERHPIYSNTSHDTPAPDEVSHNMHIQTVAGVDHGRSGNVIRFAPKSNSKGEFWCRHCRTYTKSSQWRQGPTGERDVCNKHFQRMLRQSKKAEN